MLNYIVIHVGILFPLYSSLCSGNGRCGPQPAPFIPGYFFSTEPQVKGMGADELFRSISSLFSLKVNFQIFIFL